MRRARVEGGTIRRRLGVLPSDGGSDHGLRLLQHRTWGRSRHRHDRPKNCLRFRGFGTLAVPLSLQLNRYSDFGLRHQRQPLRDGVGANGGAAEPAYAERVSLDQTRMQIDDELLNLSPGMAVTVEIKTGTRRIIDICSRRSCAICRRVCGSGNWRNSRANPACRVFGLACGDGRGGFSSLWLILGTGTRFR
jgi:hypothetical protein